MCVYAVTIPAILYYMHYTFIHISTNDCHRDCKAYLYN